MSRATSVCEGTDRSAWSVSEAVGVACSLRGAEPPQSASVACRSNRCGRVRSRDKASGDSIEAVLTPCSYGPRSRGHARSGECVGPCAQVAVPLLIANAKRSTASTQAVAIRLTPGGGAGVGCVCDSCSSSSPLEFSGEGGAPTGGVVGCAAAFAARSGVPGAAVSDASLVGTVVSSSGPTTPSVLRSTCAPSGSSVTAWMRASNCALTAVVDATLALCSAFICSIFVRFSSFCNSIHAFICVCASVRRVSCSAPSWATCCLKFALILISSAFEDRMASAVSSDGGEKRPVPASAVPKPAPPPSISGMLSPTR